MPDEINQEIAALEKLVGVLENAQTNLEGAGLSVESLTTLINDLRGAIEGLVSIMPSLEQVSKATEAVTSGEGGRVRLGGLGQRRFDLAARGYQQPPDPQRLEVEVETGELEEAKEVLSEFQKLITETEPGFAGFQRAFNDSAKNATDFKVRIKLLSDELKELGVSEEKIKRLAESFVSLEQSSPKEMLLTLEQLDLDLPDEEVKKLAESFTQVTVNERQIVRLVKLVESLRIPPESVNQIVRTFATLGVSVEKVNARIGRTTQTTEELVVPFVTVAGAGDKLTFTLDKTSREILAVEQASKKAKPAIAEFAETLQARGVDRPARKELAKQYEEIGATDFTKLRFKELEEGVLRVSTSLKIGSRGAQEFTRYITQTGEVVETVGRQVDKSPLRRFMEDLKAFEIPRGARRQITEETFGAGKELTGVRLTELDRGFTKLTGTIRGAGGATKAYVAYIDQAGKVLRALPIKEATVSIKEFTDQLAGRVGAIDNVNKMLERYKYQLTDLRKMTTEASTGITRLEFAMKGQGAATERLTLHVTQFGKVLTDTQRRFRTFAGGIARNIGHSFQWAVAITAVYGPLRKLQDLISLSIDNEAKLADIGVVLGKTTNEIQDVFEDAAQAAIATGESLNGVIEGYSLAYRATGQYESEIRRAEVAQQLLIDSLVLSKLSTLEQAEAMDTLVAALLQSNMELDEGAELLNKWVAVSKAANVSVDTLASSFAIMSTAAENVGLEFDELNAVIAVVAANTELSATQAGNAVRAFVSGFQTDKAREELSKFGIAVETLDGDARDFMAVMFDIQELMEAGLISDAELNRIGTALGGRGARRGAQFVTFLESLDEVQRLTAVSAQAQGDAYDALGVKMDTVQTAVTNLATQFQVLANAVGTEGGVLDLLRLFLELLTNVTEAATEFVGIMGKAAPFLAAAGGLYAYGRSIGRVQQLPTQFGGLVAGIGGRFERGQQAVPGARTGWGMTARQTGQTMAQSWGRTATRLAPYLGTLMAQGVLAGFNIADKDWDGLGAQIGGGIVGFMKGGPLGSIIGSTIAETVINGLQQAGQSGELADIFKGIFAEAAEGAGGDEADLSRQEQLLKQREELETRIVEEFGNEWEVGLQLFSRNAADFIRDLVGIPRQWQREMTGQQVAGGLMAEAVARFQTGGPAAARRFGTQQAIPGLQGGWLAGPSDEEVRQRIALFRELLAIAEDIEEELEAIGETDFLPGGEQLSELEENAKRYGDYLDSELLRLQDEYMRALAEGELTQKEYAEAMERMGEGGESILQVFTVLNDVMGDSKETLSLIADVITKTTQEEIDIITNFTSGIDDLTEKLKEAEAAGDLELKLTTEQEITQAYARLEAFFNQVRAAQREPLIQLVDPEVLDIRPEEFEIVREEALRILQERLQEYIRLGIVPDDTTVEEFIATGEVMAVAFAEVFGAAMRSEMSTVLEVFPEAIEGLRGAQAIEPERPDPSRFRIQTVDMTQRAFMAAYERQLQFLQQAFGDFWQPTLEAIGIIFSDGVDVLHLDNLAMQLAMQDLIDVNQKQLEGVYNLPTDASFYVPFQGYRLGFDGEGGLGGAASGLSGAADQLKEAATDLKSLEPGEDWGESFETVMKEWFGAELVDRPTEFEAFYPRFEMPDLVGPIRGEITEAFPKDIMASLYEQIPKELTVLEQIRDTLERLFTVPDEPSPLVPLPLTERPETTTVPLLNRLLEFLTGIFTTGGAGGALPFGVGTGLGIGPDLTFNKLDSAATKLENSATLLQPELQPLGTALPFGGFDFGTEFGGVLDLLNQKISNLSGFTTNLKISSTTTTNLIVDGRTLAQVIKPYLYTDMIRFEDSATSVTKNVVV